jgi:hypothetical protein
LAAVGSKFDGTGFEKLQMVHTHVAEDMAGESATDRDEGDEAFSLLVVVAEPLRCWEVPASEVPRARSDDRF